MSGRHRERRSPVRRAVGAVGTTAGVAGLTVVAAVAVEAVMTLGAGAGSAATATAVGVTLSPAAGQGDLKPGRRGTLRLTATNPETVPVRIAGLALDTSRGTNGVTVSGGAGCAAGNVGFVAQDNAGRGWEVPARSGGADGSLALTLPASVSLSATAPDGCQGRTVTVFLEARP